MLIYLTRWWKFILKCFIWALWNELIYEELLVIFFPWTLKSPVYLYSHGLSFFFSAQIRPILNRAILKMSRHLALLLFSLSSLCYLLFTSRIYSSNKIHRNHSRKRKMMLLTQGRFCFPKILFWLSKKFNKHCWDTNFRFLLVLSWALLHSTLFHLHTSLVK